MRRRDAQESGTKTPPRHERPVYDNASGHTSRIELFVGDDESPVLTIDVEHQTFSGTFDATMPDLLWLHSWLRFHRQYTQPRYASPSQYVKPPTSGRPPVSPDEALAVYQAKLNGKSWQEIARAVLKARIPNDPKERDALRGRIRYREALGARLSRQGK